MISDELTPSGNFSVRGESDDFPFVNRPCIFKQSFRRAD